MNVSGNLHKLFHHFFIWTFNDRVKGHPKGHDYGHHFLCWLSGVVPFNTWLISSWEEKKLLLKADQLTKWQLFSLKVTTLTISSEIDVILCICSACNNIYSFFSTWDKSCVKWDNSWNSTQKMRTYIASDHECSDFCKAVILNLAQLGPDEKSKKPNIHQHW